ncbi:MAG: thioredoxin domain-containing protein [bacterium]|nr:thioredoxin domain-containing protein [bacterium]
MLIYLTFLVILCTVTTHPFSPVFKAMRRNGMPRRWDRPRQLRVRFRAGLSILIWVMLAVGWGLPASTAYAQPDPFHESIIRGLKKLASGRLDLPGLEPFPEGLNARLMRAYQAKGPDYQPRTHHLHPSGAPHYINRLIFETSPYLLQHAHNPVNWYGWGPEAFAAARASKKVIFLSIGYSTCYWCHVMEKESYEDAAVAEVLNHHFISIKVDREERPDVDKIYMDAVVAMRGRGGWPLNVFLTPDREPFWGATYFPKDQFLRILERINTAWEKEPAKIQQAGLQLTQHLRASNRLAKKSIVLDENLLRAAYDTFSSSFDEPFGGFGRAPKFPPSMRLQLLMRMAHRAGEPRALQIVETTLDRMARGGIYDHLAGGFHRYATDRRWEVPHFEKMLYDNALLAWTYLEAYQITRNPMYASVARETLDYVLREMTHPEGAFYSAQDAGEVGREGSFYVWTASELAEQLTAAELALVEKAYGVTDPGNFDHGANILNLQEAYGWEVKSRPLVQSAHRKLLAVRLQRVPPLKDDKVLTAWNGLMIASMAKAYQVLGEKRYLTAAQRAARFIKRHLVTDGVLRRSYRDGKAPYAAYLDDYAYLISGLLALYEADFDRSWIRWARSLQARQDDLLWGGQVGAYYFSRPDDTDLIRRSVDFSDGARPNSNAVSALNLLKLHDLTFHRPYREKAKALLVANSRRLVRAPWAYAQTLIALDYYLDRSKEIAVIGPAEDDQTHTLVAWLWGSFLPNKTLGLGLPQENDSLALLARKPMIGNKTTVYVCENNVCKLPTGDLEQVKQLVSDIKTYSLAPPSKN